MRNTRPCILGGSRYKAYTRNAHCTAPGHRGQRESAHTEVSEGMEWGPEYQHLLLAAESERGGEGDAWGGSGRGDAETEATLLAFLDRVSVDWASAPDWH